MEYNSFFLVIGFGGRLKSSDMVGKHYARVEDCVWHSEKIMVVRAFECYNVTIFVVYKVLIFI